MLVRASDGSRCGVVTACGSTRFYLRKGLLQPKKYVVPYAEINDFKHGEVVLRRGRDSLTEAASGAGEEEPLSHTKPLHSLPPGTAQ